MQKLLGFCLFLLLSQSAWALTPWQKVKTPVEGTSQAIGGFSNGCLIGAKALPKKGEGYQIMRESKLRYFGHPNLITFIESLANKSERFGLGTLLIGDMAMPAGGRFASGHASHQTGLDVDIWLQLPATRWSKKQLANPVPIDLVNAKGNAVDLERWRGEYTQLIKLAAESDDVTRIFVHPAIKQQLCKENQGNSQWLRKVRPWFGHRAHMHVRIACPAGSKACIEQDVPPKGDGCGKELASWLTERHLPSAKPDKAPPPKPPKLCQQLLDNDFSLAKISSR